MVAYRRKSYRAASVPSGRFDFDEPISLPDPVIHSHRTRQISNAALDASDTLSAASKRNDQYLIKEINDRLAQVALAQPPPVVARRRRSVSRAPSVSRPTSSVAIVTSAKPLAADNSDVNRDVDLLMPTTTRFLRGRSVPPNLHRSALVPVYSVPPVVIAKEPYVGNGTSYGYINGPLNYGYYLPPVPYSRYHTEKVPIPDSYYYSPLSAARLTPSADVAVRQAHRDLDRIEQELKTDATLSPPAAPVPVIRTYATMEPGPILRRRTSYYGGPVTGLANPYPVYYPSYYSASWPNYYHYPTTSLPYYSTVSNHSYAPDTDVLTVKQLLSGDLSSSYPSSYSSLHTPGYSSSYVSGVIPSSAELGGNIDALLLASKSSHGVPLSGHYTRPASASVTSYVPPSTSLPATSSPPSGGSGVKPQMSEARRKAREILCRQKNDPKYFG